MALALPARAKLNLDLEVLGRNADGFHDIRSTFQSIELHDVLEIEPAEATSFASEGFAVDQGENTLVKAHRALEEMTGRRLPVRLHLHKRIPPGSGMGGASSDAAITLLGLRRLFNLQVDLKAAAEEIGSDVPFFLAGGGMALVEGRGERVTPMPNIVAWFAIAWPGIELSTKAVYAAWDEVGGHDLRSAAEFVEPRLAKFARELGDGWLMTGSGSAFFKTVNSEEEGRKAIANLDCWKTVTRSAGRWD